MNTETEIRFDRELDARGLNCPLPILRTKKSLNDMTHGQVLKIVATDPGSVRDFQDERRFARLLRRQFDTQAIGGARPFQRLGVAQ